ncbi:hypothetical protein, partial [Alloprevotella tannerae]|uniref:hypothetical protein n=1 Tax=Alloprevotella tannerae TaxID=76122 RepID=UPI003617B77C
GMIQRLVPDARIGIGHGQMDGKDLEEVMLAFINDSKTADGEAGRRISGVFFSVNEKNGKRM